MKNVLAIIFVILMTITAAIAAIPPAVATAFAKKFPDVTDVKWQKEANSNYEAHFTLNEKDISVTFAKNGKWLETKTEIAIDEVPAAVMTAFHKKTTKKRIPKAASKIESSKKSLRYELEYHHIGIQNREIFYDESGKEMKQ
jgi:Putative beta-lactamase-inhibitor-like, PepSY-like